MNYETEPVSKLKDGIRESLEEQQQAGLLFSYLYEQNLEYAGPVLGLADAIGNHLVETIFKDNDDYQINIDIDDR